jgi:hypothetical protein
VETRDARVGANGVVDGGARSGELPYLMAGLAVPALVLTVVSLVPSSPLFLVALVGVRAGLGDSTVRQRDPSNGRKQVAPWRALRS